MNNPLFPFLSEFLEHLLNVCYCLCGVSACWIVIVCIYYFIRVNYLKRAGVDWHARIQQIPGFDEEE